MKEVKITKENLFEHLKERGYEVTYLGTDKNESVDYPDKAKEACQEYLKGGYEFGIVLCGTGIGISISANKVKGVRCALCSDTLSARMTRLHNDANVLAMGAGIVGPNLALDIVETFLTTDFSGEERHQRRIDLIED